MLKTLLVVVFAVVFVQSEIALAEMKTIEKWTCTKSGLTRLVRLYAPSKGEAPCKVFYYKRDPQDPNDAKTEEAQNSGLLRPIYYAVHDGGFCVRKMEYFLQARRDQGWDCVL